MRLLSWVSLLYISQAGLKLPSCWYSENVFIDSDSDFILWVIQCQLGWARGGILLQLWDKTESSTTFRMCSAQGSRRLPCKKSTLLLPPPPVSRLARLAACPALGDDYFLVVIRSPSTNHSTRFTQPDQSEDCIASLHITFLPSSVLPLMGHHQPHYYAVARTGKLNINNITIYDWALGQISCHHQIAKLHDTSLSMMHERSSTHHWFVC